MTSSFGILHHYTSIGKQYTYYMLGVYVTRSILQRSEERKSFNELLKTIQEAVFQPTAICVIKRAADNLINFQAVVKKRLSKLELPKCCRAFQQQSQAYFVSNQRPQVLKRIFFSVQNELLCSRALPYSPHSREKGCQFFRTTRFRLLGTQANERP